MDAAFPAHMMPAIREFFAAEATRVPGDAVYFDVFKNEGFFPLQRQFELLKMIHTARTVNPRVVMEIGADKGGGFYHWCKGLVGLKKAIAVEIRGCPYAEEFVKAFPDLKFLFRGESSLSKTCHSAVQEFLGEDKIDVLFIDGDKARFVDDLRFYLPFLRPGGIAFMHDIQDPSPGRAFEEARKLAKSWETIIDKSDADAAVERERKGIPPAGSHEGWLRVWKGASCGVGVLHF